jgi:hypothetical protein
MPKKSIPSILRRNVWIFYEGQSLNGNCLCCNSEINYDNFHCGHVLAEANEGELSIENLRPLCQHCNLSMGTKHMLTFIKENKLKLPNNFYGINRSIVNNTKIIIESTPVLKNHEIICKCVVCGCCFKSIETQNNLYPSLMMCPICNIVMS